MTASCPTWNTRLSTCILCKGTLFKEEKLPAHISLNADCVALGRYKKDNGSHAQLHLNSRTGLTNS